MYYMVHCCGYGLWWIIAKITKLAGIAQKLYMINKGIKKFTRKPNESWLNLVKRILCNQTGGVM